MPSKRAVAPRRKQSESRGVRLRDSISKHFHDVNHGSEGRYLSWLSREHPTSYVALVSKVIPQQVAVEVNHHAIDLGQQMIEAAATLDRLNAELERKTIDQEPDSATSDLPSPHRVEISRR